MRVIGQALLNSEPKWLKFIFNSDGIIFAMPSLQHREIGSGGISYQDEGGNALAGMIINGSIQIRGHSVLKPEADKIRELWNKVRDQCNNPYLSSLAVSLQGENILPPLTGGRIR